MAAARKYSLVADCFPNERTERLGRPGTAIKRQKHPDHPQGMLLSTGLVKQHTYEYTFVTFEHFYKHRHR
eukprot:7543815-Pyramimonas_sp.AAC.1